MKKMVIFFLGLSLASSALAGLSYEQSHTRSGLEQAIPDQGYTSYSVDDFSLNKIESIQLSLTVSHQRSSDLLIILTAPNGDYLVLHNMQNSESERFQIVATEQDLLASLVGKSAIGRWEVQLYDQVHGVSGTLDEIDLKINGGDLDQSIDRPFPNITGSQCGEKWSEIIAVVPYEQYYKGLVGNCGGELIKKIKLLIDDHRSMSYDSARRVMFTSLDNNGGKVCSVYSERCLSTRDVPPNHIMNCEHSWPQSKGAVGDAQSDLHHLFPAMSKENSSRSSHPFCEIDGFKDPNVGSLGISSERTCFEPKDSHKGDLARAMFYFALRYNKKINTFQEKFFRKWNKEDRVSMKEVNRNNAIENYQGNRNPFIDHPELVDLISDF